MSVSVVHIHFTTRYILVMAVMTNLDLDGNGAGVEY